MDEGQDARPDPAAAAGAAAHPGSPYGGASDSQLRRFEHLVEGAEAHVFEPAWRRATAGEPRFSVTVAIVVAIGLQVTLPSKVAAHPAWVLPALAGVLLVGLVVANPRRVERESPVLRAASMSLIAVMSLANAFSAGRLVDDLIAGTNGQVAGDLLRTGGAIWLTNVLVFSLWYWELDRGGPVARAHAARPHPDFLFPQMTNPELAPRDWEPAFLDYLYMSFTNATAFSPTDVMPLSRWAKLLMMIQSAVSLTTVALVVARAVNILK